MIPSIGDIWEWHHERYNSELMGYIDVYDIILILTYPTEIKNNYDEDSGLIFHALVLDGRNAGVIQDWYMYDSDRENWRRLA